MSDLPGFRYHPNPVATGAIKSSDVTCVCCRQRRGFIYASSPYCKEDLTEKLCPWCIADGSAADKYSAEFTDGVSLVRAKVPAQVVEEVCKRTPGFIAWQEELWLACCNDACAFLGDAAPEDLESLQGEERQELLSEWEMSDEDFDHLIGQYQPGGSTAVYKFRCLHCGRLRFYYDLD